MLRDAHASQTPAIRSAQTPTPSIATCIEGPLALRDGAIVYLRAIRPEDAERLAAFHAGLSRETLVLRYFQRAPALSPTQAAELACVDYQERMVLLATGGPGLDAAILAVARYDRTAAGEAEVGFVVADAWQGRGIGTALFSRLVAYARSVGITMFVASTMAHNTRVLGLLRRSGYPTTSRVASSAVELRLDISLDTSPTPASE